MSWLDGTLAGALEPLPHLAFITRFCYHASMSETHITVNDWNIIGHEHAINALRRAIVSDRVRHAYLFTGPEHIGKALLARRFAQTLLCTGGTDLNVAPQNPCNTCLSCRKVM